MHTHAHAHILGRWKGGGGAICVRSVLRACKGRAGFAALSRTNSPCTIPEPPGPPPRPPHLQALRYEVSDNSRLSKFLISRAVSNPVFAIMLHWYLFTGEAGVGTGCGHEAWHWYLFTGEAGAGAGRGHEAWHWYLFTGEPGVGAGRGHEAWHWYLFTGEAGAGAGRGHGCGGISLQRNRTLITDINQPKV